MYVRVFAEDGHLSQYSKTSLRICGMNATWPFAGREVSDALRSGLVVGGSLAAIIGRSEL